MESGQTVLDVGCGPGALTAELVGRLGAEAVASVDPSEPFVEAARARSPMWTCDGFGGGPAVPERLFDAALAQLVVHFMTTRSRASPRWPA